LTVIAAGRHASAATDAAVPHRPLDLDASDFAAELGRLAPDVVIHCAGGKDRTGLLTALLLHVAGVDVDEIAAD